MAIKKESSVQKARSSALTDEEALLEVLRLRELKAKVQDSATQDSFVNYQHNVGVGANNPLSTATYGFNPITRQRTLLEWMYRGSWIAGKLVDSIPDDMTRAGVDLLGELEPDKIQKIEARATHLQVWDSINDAMKWGRLYGGGAAVILIEGQTLSEPLRADRVGKGQFKGLLAVDRWMIEPSLTELITELGPDLGMPKFYKFNSMSPAFMGKKIHHSRIIRFEGIKLPYWQKVMENLWGLSILERLYDRLIAFDSASNGAAQLVYKAFLRHYKIKNFREIMAAGGDALIGLQRQVDQMRQWQGIEGMSFMDSDDEIASDSHTAFGGLSDILIRFMEQCSGAEQIPLVRLFGQSPAGFSTGDTDLRNYYDTIDQRRQKELMIPMTLIYRLIAQSEGIQLPDGFSLMFRSLWQLTDPEKADLAGKNADTITRVYELDLIDKPTALKELKQQSKSTGLFTNITEEDIQAAALEPPPPPEGEEVDSEENSNLGNNSNPPDPESMDLGGEQKAENIASHSENNLKPKEISKVKKIPALDENPDIVYLPEMDEGVTCAGILYLADEDFALLIKRADTGKWAFPGGNKEAGETPDITAVREFYEEVGKEVAIKPGSPYYLDSLGKFRAFVVKGAGFKPKINYESATCGWFDFKSKKFPVPMHSEALKIMLAEHSRRYG